MKGKYHIISLKDFDKLVKEGHVKRNVESYEYNYHDGMPHYIPITDDNMLYDVIGKIRRVFTYDLDTDKELMDDPLVEGLSGEYGEWFVPSWCIVEWLQKRGIL